MKRARMESTTLISPIGNSHRSQQSRFLSPRHLCIIAYVIFCPLPYNAEWWQTINESTIIMRCEAASVLPSFKMAKLRKILVPVAFIARDIRFLFLLQRPERKHRRVNRTPPVFNGLAEATQWPSRTSAANSAHAHSEPSPTPWFCLFFN